MKKLEELIEECFIECFEYGYLACKNGLTLKEGLKLFNERKKLFNKRKNFKDNI